MHTVLSFCKTVVFLCEQTGKLDANVISVNGNNAVNSNFAVLRKHLRISRNTLLLLSSRNLNILRNKLYIWNLQITRFKMIYDMFVF